MSMMKNISILTGAFVMALSLNSSFAAEESAKQMKVAIVNVQEVLQKSPRVTALSKKLETEFKSRQTKINDDQKSYQDSLDKLKKDAATMSQKDKDAVEKKMKAQKDELVKQYVNYQHDLQKEQQKAMQGILKDLNGIVTSIAKDKNYSLVLDAQAVIFASDGADITKDVADQFNKNKS